MDSTAKTALAGIKPGPPTLYGETMPYKSKEKQRAYGAKWIASRRKEFFHDKACAICGSNDNLELDHIDRKLKVDHKIWSWALERRTEELAKCQVLCHSCHIEKTSKENQRPITHGNSGYRRGCRCSVCFSEHSARMKLRVR